MAMKSKSGLWSTVAALCFVSASAQAQNIGGIFRDDVFSEATSLASDLMDSMIPGVTNVRIGLGPVLATDYEGSDHYDVRLAPLISLRYKDLIQVDNNQIRLNLFGGTNALFESTNFRAGPLVSVDFGRDESDSLDLTGLGNIGTSFEVGGFASYTMGPLRYRVRMRHDVASGHNGLLGDFDISLAVYRSKMFSVGSRIGTTWADGRYLRTVFGINAAQAAASGLAPYAPTSGFKDISLSVGGEFKVTPSWAIIVNGGVQRLMSKAKNSPLVATRGSANQFTLGAYAAFAF
ncbi:MAG: MipA/OmpV family protein [Rhodospirillaceae bacterium]|nr:MipA/OmpV family protein [Rhodospirillaceae bacterium]